MPNVTSFVDEIIGNDTAANRQSQDKRSIYLNLYADFRRETDTDKESINGDFVIEIELIKQVEINVD